MRQPRGVASALDVVAEKMGRYGSSYTSRGADSWGAGVAVAAYLMCFRRVFKVRAFNNGVNRARLLAEATEDALGHVNVVAGCAAGAIVTGLGLDCDGLGGADSLAQLARNTALLSARVPTPTTPHRQS